MPTDGPTSPRPQADPVFDLAAFLTASARGAVEESVLTASLRLLHAASRLAAVAEPAGSPGLAFVRRLAARIDAEAGRAYMRSERAYVELLDELVAMVAGEVRARAGLADGGEP